MLLEESIPEDVAEPVLVPLPEPVPVPEPVLEPVPAADPDPYGELPLLASVPRTSTSLLT